MPMSTAYSPHGLQPLCVLVVDDDRNVADSLAAFVRLSGHRAAVAYDGPAALEAARTHQPDVVLLDLSLPGLDGYQVGRALRPEVGLLVAMSGYTQQEHLRRCDEVGFDDFLQKPFGPDELRRLLPAGHQPWQSR